MVVSAFPALDAVVAPAEKREKETPKTMLTPERVGRIPRQDSRRHMEKDKRLDDIGPSEERGGWQIEEAGYQACDLAQRTVRERNKTVSKDDYQFQDRRSPTNNRCCRCGRYGCGRESHVEELRKESGAEG